MKKYNIVKFVIFVAIAISVIFLKEVYVENLRMFIGSLITLYGVDSIAQIYFDNENRKAIDFCKGLVEIILGVCTLLFFKDFASVCVIWAVWSIMREADEINECYECFRERLPFILNSIESIVAIVFSVMLIANPTEHHAMTHMYLLIVELITTVLFPQIRFAYIKYIKNKCNKEEKE